MGGKLTYQAARGRILDADILLFKSRDPMARLISRFTHSPYAHAALAFRLDGRLLCFESVPVGVRLIPLSRRVAMLSRHGAIDVYRVRNGIPPERVRKNAFAYLGQGYDFGGIWRFAQATLMGHVPKGDASRLYCSEVDALALELNINTNFVAPGDLARYGDFQFSISRPRQYAVK